MKKTVKAMGSVNYSFESLWKHFGLVYNKLDSSDKILISSIILDSYTLEIHEKGFY